MWNYFSKFLTAFCYGAGFILAIVCVLYAMKQYSNSSVQSASSSTSKYNALEDIEVYNISKLSNFTNYSNEGRKEEFIFTGELKNKSQENSYEKLRIEIDIYDADNKFIFKCGGWNGTGIILRALETTTFQETCYRMPAEIATRYSSHKVLIK
jgi:hypothetical protein